MKPDFQIWTGQLAAPNCPIQIWRKMRKWGGSTSSFQNTQELLRSTKTRKVTALEASETANCPVSRLPRTTNPNSYSRGRGRETKHFRKSIFTFLQPISLLSKRMTASVYLRSVSNLVTLDARNYMHLC